MIPEYTVMRVDRPDWTVIPAVRLEHMPWLAPCAVSAQAQVCRDAERLYIRMEAKESPVRAELTGLLDQVCEDSCLEFFFAPLADDARYFNFEWNPKGTLFLGFGAERGRRVRQIVSDTRALFMQKPFETAEGWGIEFCVPASFIRLYMPAFGFAGEAAGNFYKCGEKTQTPHYLAWAKLTSDTPDYHRRQDFGRLIFEPVEEDA